MEPGLLATWQLLALTKGKSSPFTCVKARKGSDMSLESCAGMESLQPHGEVVEEEAASFPCPPVPPRAGQSCWGCPGGAQEQGQGWSLLWGLLQCHQQNNEGTGETWRWALQGLLQVWLAGSQGGWAQTITPLPPLCPHLQGLQQVRPILGTWALLQGREHKDPAAASSEPGCRDGTDHPNSIHHLP